LGKPLVEVCNLKKYFPVRKWLFRVVGHVKAVDGVDLDVRVKSTHGLIGESGCGKTTLGRTIIRLMEPTDGKVFFDGVEITGLDKKELRELRKNMRIVFQDPFSSLDPRMCVRDQIAEGIKTYVRASGEEIDEEVLRLLKLVGLKEEHMWRYPHELSGGQNQRVAIARAITLNPKFVVLDEPTSALDVSVQAQILELLKDLQDRFNLSYLFISHDLSVVGYISDDISVMYVGNIVEVIDADRIWEEALHPYTQCLLSAVPIAELDVKKEKKMELTGEVPSPVNPPPGCRFHPRCPYVMDVCKTRKPELVEAEHRHFVACHRAV
jgi:oligopeptide/dipeptide ABC transporter ATP-binding protein